MFTSYDLAEQAVYENGELRMTSVRMAINMLNQYAGLKFSEYSAEYKEIYDIGNAINTILGSYKAMIPSVLQENEFPGIDDPVEYYGETLPALKEGTTVYYMEKSSDIITLRLVDKAMKKLVPTYNLDMVKEAHDKVGFVSEYEDVASFKEEIQKNIDELIREAKSFPPAILTKPSVLIVSLSMFS